MHDGFWYIYTLAIAGEKVAHQYRVETRLSSHDLDSSITHNGATFSIDSIALGDEDITRAEDFRKHLFNVSNTTFSLYNGGHDILENVDKNGEVLVPVTVTIRRKKLGLNPLREGDKEDELDVEAEAGAGAGIEKAAPTPKNATGAIARTGNIVNDLLPDETMMKNVVALDFSNPQGAASRKHFERIRLDPSIKLNQNDPNWKHFNAAESYFIQNRDKGRRVYWNVTEKTIDHIEYVVNRELQEKFDAKKAQFRRNGIPDNQVLAFGYYLKAEDVDDITRNNLDYTKHQMHFARDFNGNYFCEYPRSLFGDVMILFEILPGREYVSGNREPIPNGYQSKKNGRWRLITDSAQFFPRYVIHLK